MIKENQRLLNILHIIVDAIIIYLSFNLAYILRLDEFNSPLIRWHIISPPLGYYKDMSQYQNLLTMIVPCYLIIYGFCGMYDPKRTSGRRAELFCLIKSNFFGIIYCLAALYFFKQWDYARLLLGFFACINIVIDYAFRLVVISILRKMRKDGKNLKHVLIVGYSRTAENYIRRLRLHPEWGYKIHGILDDNKKIGDEYRTIKVVDRLGALEHYLSSNEFDEIVITLSIDEYSKLEGLVAICEKSGVHTKFAPDYNNIIPTKPYTEDLDGIPVIHVRHVPLSSS